MTPTILTNTITEAGALMIQSIISSSYSGSALPEVFVSRGRNNVMPRPIPNVVIYLENVTYPENLNTRYDTGSGASFTVQNIGKCQLGVEIEQYAKDTAEDDLLSFYVFGSLNYPKQLLEQASSGSLFIYSQGQPEILEQLNIDDNTWIQKYSVPILATITT